MEECPNSVSEKSKSQDNMNSVVPFLFVYSVRKVCLEELWKDTSQSDDQWLSLDAGLLGPCAFCYKLLSV